MSAPCDLAGFIDPLVTLAAAFAGAWFAFLFERTHKQAEEKSRRIGAANRALYTVFNLWNVQTQVKKEIIDDWREKPDAWLNMPATMPARYGLTTFEAGELSFLLGKDAMVYTHLLLEEQRFDLAMQLVEQRSQLIMNTAFPRLAAARVGLNEPRDSAEIEQILGIDVVRKLKLMTSGIITNVEENLISLVAIQDQLRAVMKKLYPDEKFIKMDSKPPNSRQDSEAGASGGR